MYMDTQMDNLTGSLCTLPPIYGTIKDYAYFYVFYVLTPIYFFVAFTGHLLLVIGFVKRAKSDPGYAFQIFLTVAKTIEIFFFTVFVITFKWLSGIEHGGRTWYRENFYLMWYAAHASTPIQNSCITTSLLFAVAMAADRLFALSHPFLYKTLTGRKRQIGCVVMVAFLGWSTSAFDWFRFRVQFDGRIYAGVIDSDYVSGWVANFLSNFRNVLRGLAVVALVACNITILVFYHRNARVKTSLTNFSVVAERRVNDRRAAESVLTILVVLQSIIISTSTSLFVVFYFVAYARPEFSLCPAGILFNCVMDAILEIGDVVTFVIVTSIDMKTRHTILAACRRGRYTTHHNGSSSGH